MNKKLLEKLKQSYSYIGLAETVLQSHADALVATGLVTDENVDDIVVKQKDFLEGLQKYNDTRVNDAVRKAGEKALKDAEEKAKKAAEEAAKKAKEEALKEVPDSVKNYLDTLKKEMDAEKEAAKKAAEEAEAAAKKALQEKEDAMNRTLQEMRDKISGFEKENADLKKAQAAKARQDAILNKAKELGIPQYRIDEGFAIADDANEEQYTQYLTNISKNIKANQLPGQAGHALLQEKEVSKEEVDSIAKSMVDNL